MSSKPIVIHGADTGTKGLRPSLRTVCGRFYCGVQETPCPGNAACTHNSTHLGAGADQLVELNSYESRMKVTCPDCLEKMAEQTAKLARDWAKKGIKGRWY